MYDDCNELTEGSLVSRKPSDSSVCGDVNRDSVIVLLRGCFWNLSLRFVSLRFWF